MLEELYKNNKPLFVGLIVLVLIIGIGVSMFNRVLKNPTVEGEIVSLEGQAQGGEETLQREESGGHLIYVDISGAVKKPGVYTLPPGSRVIKAVEACGGLVPGADTSAVNMARPLKDGEKLDIPFRKRQATVYSEVPGTGTPGGPVNINTADEKGLDALPGVGPSMAKKIIAFRTENGPFSSPEDLKNVPGIGDSKFEKLKNSVTVN